MSEGLEIQGYMILNMTLSQLPMLDIIVIFSFNIQSDTPQTCLQVN